MCGRVIGYQVASPDGFGTEIMRPSIDQIYVDGISITHGSPRKHIWTYAGGFTDIRDWFNTCQCMASAETLFKTTSPPSFVGDNYYCESANSEYASSGWDSIIFRNDILWDGEQCENEGSCCTTKSPPWFSVELSNPTTDDIEVRICGDESTENEDTPIELLEIYVQ